MRDFTFIHVADPQIPWRGTGGLVKTVQAINRLRPDFVVVGGDLINNDADSEDHDFGPDNEMAGDYLSIMAGVDDSIPVHHVPGNHDICNVPTPETLAWFERTIGPCWYAFEFRETQLIVLCSDLLKNPDKAPARHARQLAWLNAACEETCEYAQRIVFMHHPLCLSDVEEDDEYFNMTRAVRGELIRLFHRSRVSTVFSGHLHLNATVHNNGLQMVTTSSCTVPRGDDPPGYRVVTVTPEAITHRYVALEE